MNNNNKKLILSCSVVFPGLKSNESPGWRCLWFSSYISALGMLMQSLCSLPCLDKATLLTNEMLLDLH